MAGVMKSNNVLPSQEPEDLDKALVIHIDLQNTEKVNNDNEDQLDECIQGNVVSEEQINITKIGFQEAEALDKALVIHKDHQVLHGDRLGGHDAVVLDMVEFEEDPLLCSEGVVNMYSSANREKLLTGCSLASQEQVHNVRSVREVHNAVVNFPGAIKQSSIKKLHDLVSHKTTDKESTSVEVADQQQNGLVIDRDEVENQSDHAQVVNNAGGSPQGKSKKIKSKPQGEKSSRTNPMRSGRAMLK
ncbi:hypothetical protein KY284_001131 [Solanum tuberosum]|nr:hypothetical protein KY284_001131 [Solanum tuberosum]